MLLEVFVMMKATLLGLKRNVQMLWTILVFQQLQAIGQHHPATFPLDVASEMVGIINLIWMDMMVWEMVEVISFQFARDPKAQVYLFLFLWNPKSLIMYLNLPDSVINLIFVSSIVWVSWMLHITLEKTVKCTDFRGRDFWVPQYVQGRRINLFWTWMSNGRRCSLRMQ